MICKVPIAQCHITINGNGVIVFFPSISEYSEQLPSFKKYIRFANPQCFGMYFSE